MIIEISLILFLFAMAANCLVYHFSPDYKKMVDESHERYEDQKDKK